MNSRNWVITGIVAALILVAGVTIFNQQDTSESLFPNASPTVSPARVVSIDLREQNNSSESGTAVIAQRDSQLIVTLNLTGAPADIPQPAHIHLGACPEPGEIKYPLNNVVNGRSETILNVTLEELESQLPLAINVHKSPQEIQAYISCGNIAL